MAYASPADSVSAVDVNGHHHPSLGPHQSEELYKRSVTLVIWHQARTEPFRLLHPVPSFPYFSLAQFPSLVAALKLTPSSFVDAYNARTGQWEQHMIHTVSVVASEQRVLYRLRESLLVGLADADCPGIADELRAQPPREPPSAAAAHALKRHAPDPPADASPPSKYYLIDTYRDTQPHPPHPSSQQPSHAPQQTYTLPAQTQTYPPPATPKTNGAAHTLPLPHTHESAVPTPNLSPQQPQPPPAGSAGGLKATAYMYPSSASLYNAVHSTPPPSLPPSSASAPPSTNAAAANANANAQQQRAVPPTPSPTPMAVPIPYHPHPPLKRWPNDYTVSEIAAGFAQMDELVGATPTLTQRSAFERVFGCRYVKSTVCRHRGVWRRADDGVRAAFVALGRTEHAVWGEFVRRVEGRASALQDAVPVPAPLALPVRVAVHEDEHEEAVMGSLGPPPPGEGAHEALLGLAKAPGAGAEQAHHHGIAQQPPVYDGGPSISNALGVGDQG